jgi:pimeloyl-ACP methyl ester carboxylesterase
MSQKPTLVFVPGAWHNSSTWDKTTSILDDQHYQCICVGLPSTASNPSATFLDDVTAVREPIIAETTQGRDVVVVVHSYGGQVGNSAIKGLTRPKEVGTSSAESQSGYVIGLVMIASGFTMTGVGFLEGLGGKPPPAWKLDPESGFAVLVAEPRELFYHDLPVEEGNYWAGKLKKQSLKALTEGGEYAYGGWMDVPVWYLVTTEDKALPVEAQRFFVQMAKDAGGDVTSREISSSHSAMLSKPEETVRFILEAVAAFAG